MTALAAMPVPSFEFDKETEPEIVMPQKQRAIVDALFEESHYESGIQALDRLRSPRYMPTIAHIRQLVFMSLYPPEDIVDIPVTASPRKLQQHRQKRARMPSEEASRLSTNLLCAFVRSNGPHALFQAIPQYRLEGVKGVAFADVANMDETVNQQMEDSPIGRDARVIGEAKDCWALLEPNVVRRKGRPVSDLENDTDEDESTSMESVVGRHSWPLLEVFVDAFEEDQKLHQERSGRRFSPILLTNIPRMKPPQPWDAGRPVNVIFSSILSSQDAPGKPYHPHRALLGIRLLSLLINATLVNMKLASSAETLVQLCVKLIKQPYCLPQHLQYILMHLSSLPQYDVFVVALVCALLEGAVVVQSYGKGDDSSASFKPVPKAKPRQRLPGAETQPGTASTSGQPAAREPYPLPSLNVVLRHLASSSVAPQFAKISKGSSSKKTTPARLEIDAQKSAIAKMHLLQSLNRIVAAQSSPGEARGSLSQPEWWDALLTKKVRNAVETGFRHVAGLDFNSEFKALVAPTCLEIVEDLEGDAAVATSTQDVPMGD